MMPDKNYENEIFSHTYSRNGSNLTLINDRSSIDVPDVIQFMIDKDGKILTLEGGGLQLVNVNKFNFLEKNINKILPSENKFLSELKTILLCGNSGEVIKCSENSFEICFTASHSLNGEENGVIGTAREISNELLLRDELVMHKGYFTQLFECSPEAIAIIDSEDRIMNVNAGFENLFSYSLDELRGQLISIIMPEHISGEASWTDGTRTIGETFKTEAKRRKKDGSEIIVSVLGYPVTLEEGKIGTYLIFNDITSRKLSEKMIRNSLFEKELLLKEIHHRVKNNLQIIGSLLKFQTKYIKDPEAIEIFKESQNRIRSISLIHEKLYQTKDLSRIEFAGYAKTLLNQLFITFGIKPDNVTCIVNANNVFLSVDNAIPCGLIINELVTNSLKYAFPDNRKGNITIEMCYSNAEYTLKISDNGIGMPEHHGINKPETLGLQLVSTLATQLDARLLLEKEHGTCYTLTFSNMSYESRI